MKFTILASAAIASAIFLTNCGGGGSSSSKEDTATVRPKTMDGIVLNLDRSTQLEFIRNLSTQGSINTGDVETGTFLYTPTLASNVLRNYDNISGSKSNFRYPGSITAATYSYRAINESSGILTLTATGTFDSSFSYSYYAGLSGSGVILNDSWIRLFYTYSPASLTGVTRIAEIAITFSSTGDSVTSDIVTLRLPESPLVSTFDTVRIPTSVRLAAGGAVPLNYNPTVNPLRASKIAPVSLTKRLLSGKNGIPDLTKDFTIQFVADAASASGSSSSVETQEVGHGILSVYDSTLVPAGLRAISGALDYTWRRIGGTDKGELILSNIPDDAVLPFDVSLNGSMILNFSGIENGIYTGSVDGDTVNAADVSGTFLIGNDK